MSNQTWRGTVTKKSRGLLDGANLYRRVTVALDGGDTIEVRVARSTWNAITVGDRLVKPVDGEPVRE
jgi:hypothetical protein